MNLFNRARSLSIAAHLKSTLNKIGRGFWLLWVMLAAQSALQGQQLPDRKRSADNLYQSGNYALAIPLYKALTKGYDLSNPDIPIENIVLLADCYRQTKSYVDAEYWYHAVVTNHKSPNISHFYYGESLQHLGKYKDAKLSFQEFVPVTRQDSVLKIAKITSCDRSLALKIVSRPIRLKNEKSLNTRLSDFGLVIYHNDFYFVSNRPLRGNFLGGKIKDSVYGWTNEPFWHLYLTHLDPAKRFLPPVVLGNIINSKFHTGPAVLNHHGDVMFFTQANVVKSYEPSPGDKSLVKASVNTNQIYVSIRLGGNWQKPLPCSLGNPEGYSAEHPALSKDEKTLIFASDMPGGKGGMDLYSVQILGGGMYTQPKNLGDSINSPGDEVFPSIASDGALYFSSNGKIGYGGLDLFQSNWKAGHWTSAVNVGKPLNSNKDDFLIWFTDPNKRTGYFSSNRDGGLGEDDIYSFIENVKEEKSDSIKASSAFLVLKKSNPKVLDSLVQFFSEDTGQRWVRKNLVLHSLLYQSGKADIKKGSLAILNQIAELLKKSGQTKLKIMGFTDNLGSPSKNVLLSAARANTVRDYLIARGVEAGRIEAEGFGSSRPIYPCGHGIACTIQKNQANRRTEFSLTQ